MDRFRVYRKWLELVVCKCFELVMAMVAGPVHIDIYMYMSVSVSVCKQEKEEEVS